MFLEAIWKAIQSETETETLICQVQSMKDIIDEIGSGFLTGEVIDLLSKLLLDMYHKSDERIKENNDMVKTGGGGDNEDEEEGADDDDLEVIKEENKSEYDLQLSIAEILGMLFKTHGPLCGNLLTELFASILPPAISSEEKQKNKFAVFLMDDMLEFLGFSILGPHYVTVAHEVIKFCNSPIAPIRQAAAYGIGMMAEKGS